jgi:rfaE bifunctional protein nucleotidyltransferase chain/domain
MKTNIQSKIKPLDKVTKALEPLRKQGKKIVHCHGVFDLLHPGHLKHFEAARKKGDVLVVTLTRDEHVNRGPGRPIFNQQLRAESIAALECVDFVAINDWPTAVETIRKLRPDFYVKGSDYTNKEDDVTGKIYEEDEAVKAVGGMLHFTDEITFSSSSLINRFLTPYPEEAKGFLQNLKIRYNAGDIINYIKNVVDTKVLVIGDIIVDEYHYCTGMGKSQKDNIVTTRFVREEQFAGGVLAAANHIAGFCEDVTLMSCIGTQNDYTDFIESHLKDNVKPRFYYRDDVPTVVKRRFVDPNFLTKLFEVCYLDNMRLTPPARENEICDYLEEHLEDFDMVLVTDFGHGFFTPKIIKLLCKKAPFLALNVQTNSSNIGFNLVTKFPRADYICIDEPELRLACHDRFSNIEKLTLDIMTGLKCEKTAITRGHRGALLYSGRQEFVHVPVLSKEVVDRIGAGDAFFSVTSPAVFRNTPMEVVGIIGNAVGALQVLIVGNRASVEPGPLFKYIITLLK